MSKPNLLTGRDLGKAICKHFGLSVDQVQSDFRIKNDVGGLAEVTLTVALTPDDLAGIARCATQQSVDGAKETIRTSLDVREISGAMSLLVELMKEASQARTPQQCVCRPSEVNA